MGCGSSTDEPVLVTEVRSGKITQPSDKGAKRVLFLGTGGSGKSTFRKQALLLYQNAFLEKKNALQELLETITLTNEILRNLAHGCRVLCEAALCVPGLSEADQRILETMLDVFKQTEDKIQTEDKWWEQENLDCADEYHTKMVVDSLKKKHRRKSAENPMLLGVDLSNASRKAPSAAEKALLGFWHMEAVQKAWVGRGKHPEVEDSLEYWFENLARILDPDFEPTKDDMLRVRRRTTRVTRDVVDVGKGRGGLFVFYDIGGQRDQRRKWKHCVEKKWVFEFTETMVVYIVNVASFDSVISEDDQTNGMQESLAVFESTLHMFKNVKGFSIMVFLNKKDVLEKKLAGGADVADHFPGCPATDAKGVAKFFFQKFYEIAEVFGIDDLKTDLVTAVSRHNMKKIIHGIVSATISAAMEETGM